MKSQSKRCIAYVRVSSDGQRDNHSLPTQRTACLEFAEEQGWQVVAVVEEVYTSTERIRPRLSEVQLAVDRGEVDVLLVYDQDRLARKQRQLNRILDEFDDAGIEVWSVRQGQFATDAISVHLTSARGLGSELENEQRRERSMRGQRAKAEKGYLLGAGPKPTFGYRWPDERGDDGRLLKHRYEVDPEIAEVVRRIFDMVLSGVSLRDVARRLNAEGIPSPFTAVPNYKGSGVWHHNTIRRILTNPYYKGEAWALIYHRQPKKKGQRSSNIKLDFDGGVRLGEGVIPAIVSAEEWDRVQGLLVGKRVDTRPVKNSAEVLLRGGLIRCGNCGRAMCLNKRRSGNRYYRCGQPRSESGHCPKPSPTISARKIEEPSWAAVRAILLEPSRLWDRFHSTEQRDVEESRLQELRGRHKAVVQRRNQLLRNLEVLGEEDAVEMRPRLQELAGERDRLAAELEALHRLVEERDGEQERFERLITWARSEAERVETLSTEERRAILLELDVRVRVFPNEAPERYVVEVGKRRPAPDFFADIDWSDAEPPSAADRRETERLFAEAAQRGIESDVIGVVLNDPGSVSGTHFLGM